MQLFWSALYRRALLFAIKRVGQERAEDVAQAAIARVLQAGTWDIADAKATFLSVGSAVNSLASHVRRKDRARREVLEYAENQDDATEAGDDGEGRAGLVEGAAHGGPNAEEAALARAKHERGLRIIEEARTLLDPDDRLGNRLLDSMREGDPMEADELVEQGGGSVRDVYNARKRVKRALETARERIPASAPPADPSVDKAHDPSTATPKRSR